MARTKKTTTEPKTKRPTTRTRKSSGQSPTECTKCSKTSTKKSYQKVETVSNKQSKTRSNAESKTRKSKSSSSKTETKRSTRTSSKTTNKTTKTISMSKVCSKTTEPTVDLSEFFDTDSTTKSSKSTGRTKSTKTRKTKTPVVEPKVNEISFINEKISKQLKFTATYNGGQYIDFAMNLKEIDGTQVHCSLSVKDVLTTLKYNYNIGIISFSKGVYSYQFDRVQFETFLHNNGLY